MGLSSARAAHPEKPRLHAAREYVQHVALELFVAQGFHAVSLRQLATAAGMQAGSLYNHIDSKQALLFELIHEHEVGLLASISSPGKKDPALRLSQFVRSYLQYNAQHPQRQLLAHLECRNLDAEQHALINAVRSGYRQLLEDALRPMRMQHTAPTLLAMLDGIASWQSSSGSSPSAAQIKQSAAMICAVISGPQS